MDAEQITPPLAHHGEGPLWDPHANVLRWVDMLSGDILTLHPVDGWITRQRVGEIAAAMRPRRDGGLVVAVERGFRLIDTEGVAGPVTEAFTDASVRMNEGACDPDGRFYCGSMAFSARPERGAMYRFDPDGTVTEMFDKVTISNGLVWNAVGDTVYYIDSPTQRVDQFDYADGQWQNRRPAFEIPREHGLPDGMAIDAEGGLWIAMWGGSTVRRYTTEGTVDTVINLPVTQVTACAFGGHDLSTMYITTSQQQTDGDQLTAGAIYAVDPGVKGVSLNQFAG